MNCRETKDQQYLVPVQYYNCVQSEFYPPDHTSGREHAANFKGNKLFAPARYNAYCTGK